ncbi:methionyl-tRNA formyltransferase [Pseudarthrobacter sulfonivorans]|uniref:methionyl-tRNA formyltransferase n=1 Tax=Pseudarthrobacter sulfonivorans TaxID=121292 RepID=UPI00168A4286|nr:methionyl-tRNA formyltransferase [Pseudarthrobacter sulfonivorans]
MRVLFAGTPAVAVPSLDALVKAGFDVVAVLTRPDAPIGRKRVLTPSPVAARAAELGIDVIHATRVDDAVTAHIAAAKPDVAAIVAYGGLIPRAALDVPPHGWINLHFSLLPAWRGAAPVQRAVIAGDDVTGAVTFLLEEGLDTGPVFGTLTESVRTDDTAGALLERLSHSGAVLLTQTLSAVEAGKAAPQPQMGDISLAPKLTIDDGRLDWKQPALAIGRRARGVTPEPGAWTTLEGQRVKLEPVRLRPAGGPALAPGAVFLDGKNVLVGTGSHAVELTRIQPSGKKMMAAADWARGMASLESVVFE